MAPRSIWKGSISFGLVSIPVGLYTAVGRETGEKIDLHLLHAKDGARIHYDRVCEKGHQDIDWDEIEKGYEYESGKWVEITDEDLEALELESLRTIDVVRFAPADQIDPMFFEKAYYIVPQEAGIKAYRLMMSALEDESLVGVAKVAIREREHLATIRVKDDTLVLHTMRWPEEIRNTQFEQLRKRPRVEPKERKMARQLIRQLAEDFDPRAFRDEYHRALKKLVRKKIKGEEIVVAREEEQPAKVADLMEALRASVEATRQGKHPREVRGARRRAKGTGKDLARLSREQLYERAQRLDIKGRAEMTKHELADAIERAS